MYSTLLTERRGETRGILWLTLNRPEKLNALSMTVFAELRDVFEKARTDRTVRCVVITGAGRGFCAGVDFSGERPPGLLYPVQESETDTEGSRLFFRNESETFIALGPTRESSGRLTAASDFIVNRHIKLEGGILKMSNEMSFLEKVKLQVELLLPILNKLREKYGRKEIDELVFEAIDEHLKLKFMEQANKIKGSGREKWQALYTDLMKIVGDDIDLELIEMSDKKIIAYANSCKTADYFKGIDEIELGYHLACKTDEHIANIGGKEVQFKKNQHFNDRG